MSATRWRDGALLLRTQTDIERLLRYALASGMIRPLDVDYARNALLDLFGIAEPGEPLMEAETPESAVPILEPLLDAAAAVGLLEENNTTLRDLLDAKIMGLLMPRPSEVADRFRTLRETESIRRATDDFYELSKRSNYIRMDRIANNVAWLAPTAYGDLEITINLSKPEKDPKEIAMLKNAVSSDYPKCLLCPENVGYAGRLNHPARQNLRVIPFELNGESWYFQYSPYMYYNEHCIVLSERHVPMRISRGTFANLLAFIDQMPHYFVGSNADLPIVGGSILNHDHFQGGRHGFPMEKAQPEARFRHPEFPQTNVAIVKWPLSVVRIASADKGEVLRLAGRLLDAWRAYSDPEAGVLAESGKDGAAVPHNTITPIARRDAQGRYEMDLVLRNNRTDERHPEGIFHPHREHHHIKKENIGLIEVMGLAVLPGRLKTELAEAERLFTGARSAESLKEDGSPLAKHADWLRSLLRQHGTGLSPEQAHALIRREVGAKFLRVLEDAGVFKRDEPGLAAFARFMRHCGFTGE